MRKHRSTGNENGSTTFPKPSPVVLACSREDLGHIDRQKSTHQRKREMHAMNVLKVLVADKHCLTAEMTASHISRELDLATVHVSTHKCAVEALETQGKFDVLLMDFDLLGTDGAHDAGKFVELVRPGHVVLICNRIQAETAVSLLQAGVRGVVPKSLPLRSLENAVRFVSMGEVYLPASFVGCVYPAVVDPDPNELTSTETDVARRIAQGFPNRAIAAALGIKESTVKMHVRSIAMKLNVRNRTQIAMAVHNKGLLPVL